MIEKNYFYKEQNLLKKCSCCNSDAKFYYVSSGPLSDSSFYLRFRIKCSCCDILDKSIDGIIEMSLNKDGELIFLNDNRNKCIEIWNGEN